MPTEFTDPDLVPPVTPGSISAQQAVDLLAHKDSQQNPHGVTKAQVGLGDVDNTPDANKPVSTAQAAAIEVAKDRANHTGTQEISTVVGLEDALASKATLSQGEKADTAVQPEYFGAVCASAEYEMPGFVFGTKAKFVFTANLSGPEQNGIGVDLVFFTNASPTGPYPPPTVSVSVDGSIITITVGPVNASRPAAEDLVNAVNAHAGASALIRAEVLAGGGTQNYDEFSVSLTGGSTQRFASEAQGLLAESAVQFSSGIPVNGDPPAKASAILGSGNAAIQFEFLENGAFGNGQFVEIYNPVGLGVKPLVVTRILAGGIVPNSGFRISPATDGSGTITSTANDVIAAVNVAFGVSDLIVATLAPGSTGVSLVANGSRNFTGGLDRNGTPGKPGDIRVSGDDFFVMGPDLIWRKSTMTVVVP